LWNYQLQSPEKATDDLDNLKINTLFTGTRDEACFYLVSVAIEARGAPLITIALDAIEAAHSGNAQRVTNCLISVANIIMQVCSLLDRMRDCCEPSAFYQRIRPFLAGTSKLEEFGCPGGLNYNNGSGNPDYRSYRGGSSAQSSLIQLMDIVLGVYHRPGNDTTNQHSGEHNPVFCRASLMR